jgi:hypothetical protein
VVVVAAQEVEGANGGSATAARGMDGDGSGQMEGGNNTSIYGMGKRRERRRKKMDDFTNPPIFVGEATSPMNICHIYSSVMCHHQRIYGIGQSQIEQLISSSVPSPNR